MDKRKNRYIYPAIFQLSESGNYLIRFPDMPACMTQGNGNDLSYALQMAREVLELYLFSLEEDGNEIPEPSAPEAVEAPAGAFMSLIEAYMPPIRDEMANKSVNKNVTLPYWLKKAGEERGINFSQLLQTALKEALGIDNYRVEKNSGER